MSGFSERTRAFMHEHGVSLRELARRTHYDSGHLSKVLAGRKGISPDVARRVDEALSAGGHLAVLVPAPMDREERLAYAARNPRRVDAGAVDALAAQLAASRRLEDGIGSAPLVQATQAQLRVVETLISEAREPVRRSLVDVAAQWAQFAGWLHTSTGESQHAHACYDQALVWAAEAGNTDMTAEALSMKGSQAWRDGQVGATIGLSQAARRDPGAFPGQHAMSAAQEARGHAMAGDAAATDVSLDAARELSSRATERAHDAPPWLYYHSPGFFDLQYGIACRYLGRHDPRRNRQAIDTLTSGLDGLDPTERRAEWAAEYVFHLAVAYCQAGEPEPACAAALDIADTAHATQSPRLTDAARTVHTRLAAYWPGRADIDELHHRLHAS